MLRVVFCTLPKDKASIVSKALLEERLVACVNIVPLVESHYIWEDNICVDEEAMLIIKTSKDKLTRLIERIKEVHPYDIPEIIAFDVEKASSSYLEWVISIVGK